MTACARTAQACFSGERERRRQNVDLADAMVRGFLTRSGCILTTASCVWKLLLVFRCNAEHRLKHFVAKLAT